MAHSTNHPTLNFVRAVAALGVALALAACGGSDADPPSTTTHVEAESEILAFRPALWCGSAGDTTDRPTLAPPEIELISDGDEDCVVGPSAGTRADVAGADANVFADQWVVEVEFEDDSIQRLDEAFVACQQMAESCPTGRLAIQLGERIVSAPLVNVPASNGVLVISGGFEQADAFELAAGILGLPFDPEATFEEES